MIKQIFFERFDIRIWILNCSPQCSRNSVKVFWSDFSMYLCVGIACCPVALVERFPGRVCTGKRCGSYLDF